MTGVVVLDASAVLASVFDEPGAEKVDAYVQTDSLLLITSVNMVEVISKLLDKGIPIDVARQLLQPLGLDETPLDGSLGAIAAQLRPLTRKAGLSLGDRCCLALARSRDAIAVTADRNWQDVAQAAGVKIDLIR